MELYHPAKRMINFVTVPNQILKKIGHLWSIHFCDLLFQFALDRA